MNARAAIHVAGHHNNAVCWQLLEEELAEHAADGALYAEVEHRAPCGLEPAMWLAHADRRWLVKRDGSVSASFRLAGLP